MKTLSLASAVIAAFVVSAASVQADTMDFSDAFFAPTFNPDIFNPYVTSGTFGGVAFSFSVTSYGTDGFRQYAVGGQQGVAFGRGGNGMQTLSITADQDIKLVSLTGRDISADPVGGPITDSLPFDIFAGGTQIVSDLTFTDAFPSTELLGGTTLVAGQTFTIAHDISNVNDAIRSAAYISSFEYEVLPGGQVPVPAALPLVLSGIGGLVALRRRRRKV